MFCLDKLQVGAGTLPVENIIVAGVLCAHHQLAKPHNRRVSPRRYGTDLLVTLE